MIKKNLLKERYIRKKKSMQEIANELDCSLHKVAYWMEKHKVPRRSWSEATYVKHNPDGDPFSFEAPRTIEQAMLMGLGLGLYWGEGTRSNKLSVRLGNTDPALVRKFVEFLEKIYTIDKKDLKFGLQIFSDIHPEKALRYWMKELDVTRDQFQKKVVVTPSRGKGTYRKKLEYGVLTVYYHNMKLRSALEKELRKLQ